MSGARAGFEIHAYRDEHWVLEDTKDSEQNARAAAKTILNKPRVGGIRIIKTWKRADGNVTENTLYEEMRSETTVAVTISPIESAPLCNGVQDIYKLESRLTAGRLLRKYVEQVFLTPTELLHNHRALKKFQEAESLYPSAVDKVASVQAKAANQDAKMRRDELYKLVTQAATRARTAEEGGRLPEFKGSDFRTAYDKVKKASTPDEADYNATVLLCRDLVQRRDWLSKIARIAELIVPDGDEELLALFDKVLADLIGIPAAFQDIIGQQRNLGAALIAIIELYDTGQPPKNSDTKEDIGKIGPLIAQGKLKEARSSLLERFVRQLGSNQPLSKNDPAHERDVLKEVMERLFRDDGILGGPDSAAALVRRFVLLQEGGGLTALKNSVGGVVSSLKTLSEKITFLLTLVKSDLAKDLNETIFENLRKLIEVNDLGLLVPEAKDATGKMIGIKGVFDMLKRDTGLPPEERARLIDRIDTLLEDLIRREGIIEKIDNPQAHLRDRALRLVEFCGSGVLPDGRALKAARERVVKHLKQPNFALAFVDGISDPNKSSEALRDFHTRLVRAGFK